MSVEDEVLSIRKKLEKMSEPGQNQVQALDILKALARVDMNLTILTNTRIGMAVNSLRKSSSDDEVVSTAKNLIKTWKKFVPDSTDSKAKPASENNKLNKSKTDNGSESAKPEDGISWAGGSDKSKCFPPKPTATADEVRISCRKLLATSLRGEGDLPDGICKPPEELAELIEDVIFRVHRGTTPKYKNQVRSRVFNLKDKKNRELRENVLCGVILPEKIATMTAEEMASDEIKKQREAFVKAGIDAAQLAKVEGTKTDMRCGKCGKRNCTYNQLQTRSADEPMTTFVMCNECGNRWKFN